jgi:hypothetical protein
LADPGRTVGADDLALRAAVDELPERCRALLRVAAFVPEPDRPDETAAGECLAELRRLMSARTGGAR